MYIDKIRLMIDKRLSIDFLKMSDLRIAQQQILKIKRDHQTKMESIYQRAWERRFLLSGTEDEITLVDDVFEPDLKKNKIVETFELISVKLTLKQVKLALQN